MTIQPAEHPTDSFHGAAAFDSPEIRALRTKAAAQARNLLNAIHNGAYPHALILRAGEAAETTRNLAHTIIETRRDI